MHKKKKTKIKMISMLFFIVLLGSLTWIVYGNDDKDITYRIHEELKEEGSLTTVTLELITSNNVKEISDIKMPNGNIEVGQNIVTYDVKENGEYTFVVYYKISTENEEGEFEVIEKQKDITYQVSSIEIKQQEQEITDSTKTTPIEEEKGKSESKETEPISKEVETYATGDVAINETNFPDENFRNWILSQSYGSDKVLTASEISNIASIDVSSKNISSLQGIEYFTSLTDLNCSFNNLNSLNVSSNRLLTTLLCEYNHLVDDIYIPSSLTTLYGSRQSQTIKMHLRKGEWVNYDKSFYYISTLGNTNISYFYKNGQFISTSTNNTSSGFNRLVDYSKNLNLDGYLTFEYVDDYVEVNNITGVPTNIVLGTTVTLNSSITPSNATENDIRWSIKDDGYTAATISGNQLTTQRIGRGTVIVTATINWGLKTGDYTQDFTINVVYADPSSLYCTFDGTLGKNGWYTSNVTAIAPNGYEMTRKLDTLYSDSLSMFGSTMDVYFRNKSTGAIYRGKSIGPVKVDLTDPTISGITNEGSEITNNDKTVTVQDTNLNSVKLYVADSATGLNSATEVVQTITNGTSSVTLRAANKDQYFKIVAEDLSGRTTTYTYTLLHPTYDVTVDNLTFDTVDYNYATIIAKNLNINYQANGANSEASVTSIISNDSNKFIVSGSGKDWTVAPKSGLSAGVHTVTLTTTHTGGTTTSTVSIVVNKIQNPFMIEQADILYGGNINPTVSNLKEQANLTYYYKLVSAGNEAYTLTVPTTPGNYNIKAISSETDNYKTTEYVTSFLIQYQLTASNACITIDEAKGIRNANDLKTYNQADSNPTGITNQISVSCTNLSSIQSGTPGNYEVKYTLLDITTTVKVQVVEGGYAVSEDRQTGFYGKDSKLTKGEAETITKEELLSQLEVRVITATGMLYEDTNKFLVDMDSIHSAGVGNNTIRIGFKEGSIDIEREVTIEILEDSPSTMISIPSSIELERVLHNETFEAVKEEKIEILSTVDTDKYSKNFYIKTEPSFTITNTEDSKEKFTVQIYDGKENKLTSKETPIAILNGSTKEERFYVKMYKGEKKKGIYKGTMNFEIGYGEGQ